MKVTSSKRFFWFSSEPTAPHLPGDWPGQGKWTRIPLHRKLRCSWESREAWHTDSWVQGAAQRLCVHFHNGGFNAWHTCSLCTGMLMSMEQPAPTSELALLGTKGRTRDLLSTGAFHPESSYDPLLQRPPPPAESFLLGHTARHRLMEGLLGKGALGSLVQPPSKGWGIASPTVSLAGN